MTATQLALPSGERADDQSTTVYGIVALGISALVIIGTLFGAWLSIRSGTKVWPPLDNHHQDYFGNIGAVTAVFGLFAGWWAVSATVKGERKHAAIALTWVILMNAAMINLITFTLRSSTLSPRTNTYALLVYAFSIAVCAIYASGIGVAGAALGHTLGGHVTKAEPSLAWAAAWYTTLVNLAWFVMYTAIYIVH